MLAPLPLPEDLSADDLDKNSFDGAQDRLCFAKNPFECLFFEFSARPL